MYPSEYGHTFVFPAQAGVILQSLRLQTCPVSVPRVGGGDPELCKEYRENKKYSWRMWYDFQQDAYNV